MQGQRRNLRVGLETLDTPALGMSTLFVSGLVRRASLEAAVEQLNLAGNAIQHLRFGVDDSFEGKGVSSWLHCIEHFLSEWYWCSFQFDHLHLPLVNKSKVFSSTRFIPLICISLPRSDRLSTAATLLIRDPVRGASWCTPLKGRHSVPAVPAEHPDNKPRGRIRHAPSQPQASNPKGGRTATK